MTETRVMMGMPITVEIVGSARQDDVNSVFDYFAYIDTTFSTYKAESEISRINRGELTIEDASPDTQEVFTLSDKTKKETEGYFDIEQRGLFDPSGLVKGWAIRNAAALLDARGCKHFFIEAGGDIETRGLNALGRPWRVGIRNPFSRDEIVKVLDLSNTGIATSGTYIRGDHIYNPHADESVTDVVSLTVIANDVYEADRFATAAFAMGKRGINFIESYPELEGYMIEPNGIATQTSGFGHYTAPQYA